jgi:hypothetical protein
MAMKVDENEPNIFPMSRKQTRSNEPRNRAYLKAL